MVKVSPGGEILHNNANKSLKPSDKLAGSSASLNSNGERPSGSATSKGSKRSQDSGYSGNDLEDDGFDEYAHIITENSENAVVQNIESNFHAPELGKPSNTH